MDYGALSEAVLDALNRQDWDHLGVFLAPDVVLEYPQSGETFRGIANITEMQRNYPGGLPARGIDTDSLRLAADERRWGLTAMFTVLPVEGTGTTATAAFKVRYPDESTWWVVAFIEVAADKVRRLSLFFAPVFDPPEWRAPYRDNGAARLERTAP